MCVNAEVSLSSFFIGVISSICLIYYGKKNFKKENLSTGIFFIYISFVQLFEYFIWTDIDNKKGINRIISIILPIVIYSQPFIFYIIKSIIFNKFCILMNILIILYIFLGLTTYNSYLQNEKLITGVKNKFLHWKWNKYSTFGPLYMILFAIVVFLYFNFYYALLLFILGVFLLIISHKISFINHDTIWCLLSAFIPIYMLIGSYLI